MGSIPPNSIWAQMSYTPPRGSCNHKSSLISGTCPCLRFMLHPLKSATSFDCDGCGHHASFHNMENELEEKVMAKWAEQESSRQPAAKKRKVRAITNGTEALDVEIVPRPPTVPRTMRRVTELEEASEQRFDVRESRSLNSTPRQELHAPRSKVLPSPAISHHPLAPALLSDDD